VFAGRHPWLSRIRQKNPLRRGTRLATCSRPRPLGLFHETEGLTLILPLETAQKAGISANVVAAYYHDPIFVPVADAERAGEALRQLSTASRKS